MRVNGGQIGLDASVEGVPDRSEERVFTAEERKQQDELLDELERAVGSYCEVRELNNMLVIIGHIEVVDRERDAITVRSSEREMPPVIFNTDFKLMIRPRGGMTMVLNGKICGSNKDIWRFDYLNRYFYKESRSYFRQPTDTSAYGACITELYHPVAEADRKVVHQAHLCRVMDISLQGIQLRTTEECFAERDWLLVSDLVLVPQQKRAHTFLCQVKRCGPGGRGEYLYGCQFAYLDEQQEDDLCSDIFVLHRLDIQSCRLG